MQATGGEYMKVESREVGELQGYTLHKGLCL